MILINIFCAWMIVLCGFTFLKSIFEKDRMTRFHIVERTGIRLAVIYIMISEIMIGIKCEMVDTPYIILNIGLCILSMFLMYQKTIKW